MKLTGFLGQVPRTAERQIPDQAAQIAENVILTSGEIRPMRPDYMVHSPINAGAKVSAYRAYNGTTEKWRAWTIDVDVARGPLSPDVEARYYWTGDSCPRYSTFTNFGTTDWALGMPAPTAKPSVAVTGGASTTTVSRAYCVTNYQPSTGEESAPSPIADVVSGKVDGTWTITNFSAAPANDRAIAYNTAGLQQRLYRTTGTAGSWQLVAVRAYATTAWTDTLTDGQILGDELITTGWSLPPVGLKGLITLPNGSMAGFYNNQLCFSEPYQPHAWPVGNRYSAESEIVGIAAYGTTVVVATKTRPYVADGVTPDVVTMTGVSNVWPCKSKRSVCSAGDGVVFATDYGLAYIGTGGTYIFTSKLMTKEEWQPLDPSSMQVAVIDSRIFVLFKELGSATKRMIRIDVGEAASFSTFSARANALYVDPMDGKLYLLRDEVYLFDGLYGQRQTFVWKSKEFEYPNCWNPGAALIEWQSTMVETEVQAAYALYHADLATNQSVINAKKAVGAFAQTGFNTDPINGATGINTPRSPAEFLKYTLLDHDVPRLTVDVLPGKPFRLPAGYKSDVFTHQLVGNVRVKYIKFAPTMDALRQL